MEIKTDALIEAIATFDDIAKAASAADATILTVDSESGGEANSAGRYVFALEKASILSVELIGGGGGGGGTSAGNQTNRGTGGNAAVDLHIQATEHFDAGTYLLIVGTGGNGGVGGGWSDQPVDGYDGEPTIISLWPNGFPQCVGKPGAGGKGDAVPMHHQGNDDYAGNGDNLKDPILGTVYHGGAGGGWQKSGDDGLGHGSGGGGQGGTTHPGQSHGGKGADGFARLARMGDR